MNRSDCSRGMWPGLILVVMGCAFLLHNYDILSFGQLWPLVFIGMGISHLIPYRNASRALFGILWLVIGGALLLEMAGWSTIGLRELWPLFLIAGGLSMALGGRRSLPHHPPNEVSR